jgi:type II secretory pathway component GspD/PulD (secretin)
VSNPDLAVTRVTIDDAQDFFSELSGGVGSLLSERGRFSLDRKTGLLQVTDHDERLEAVRMYVDRAQTRAHVQVQIETQILEVELTDASQLSIDWAAVVGLAARPGAASRGVRSIAALSDFPSVVVALTQQGRVTVRSSPTLVTLNNEPVVMRSGARGPWIDGVDLTVTPQVSATGLVSLSVSPSIRDSRVGDTRAPGRRPIVSVREIDTVVQVQSGDTVALTGLLGGTPKGRTEIVVLLKPTIVPRS